MTPFLKQGIWVRMGCTRDLNGYTQGCSVDFEPGRGWARWANFLGQEWAPNLTSSGSWVSRLLVDTNPLGCPWATSIASQLFLFCFVLFLFVCCLTSMDNLQRFAKLSLLVWFEYKLLRMAGFTLFNLTVLQETVLQFFIHRHPQELFIQDISPPAWKQKKTSYLRTSWCIFFHLLFSLILLLDKSLGSMTDVERLFPSHCTSGCKSFPYVSHFH